MDWVKTIERAIAYIENNITEELTIGRIASEVNVSAFYFQKGFSMLCGYTVGEYIRMRRLSLAGSELLSSDARIIDLAVKYGYDSPDSFTKAFARFHGSTPTDIRKNGAALNSFAPLHIRLSLEGGTVMNYRIEKKPAFKVMGVSKTFSYESANTDIPAYWDEVHVRAEEKAVTGMYGIRFDTEMATHGQFSPAGDPCRFHCRKSTAEFFPNGFPQADTRLPRATISNLTAIPPISAAAHRTPHIMRKCGFRYALIPQNTLCNPPRWQTACIFRPHIPYNLLLQYILS